ncbi:MAG: hypothetical protein WC878_06690 [Candidatus Paceibacterota bacterium]
MEREDEIPFNPIWYEEGSELVRLFSSKSDKKSDVPVLIVLGWGARSLDFYKKSLSVFAESKNVIAVNISSGLSDGATASEKNKEKKNAGFSDISVRKAEALLLILKKNKTKTVDVAACSEGAITVTLAAMMEPARFRNIVFVNPAGIGPGRNPWRFMFAYAREIFLGVKEAFLREIFWEKTRRVCAGPFKKILSHPYRSFMEMSNIARADIRRHLFALKKKGIRISVLSAKKDTLFPLNHIRLFAEKDLFVEMRESEGRHSDFIFGGPRTVLQMFSVLENKTE